MAVKSEKRPKTVLPRIVYVLLLLAADKAAPIVGKTRLEKLVFLIQERVIQGLRLVVSEEVYHFRPLHFGPFSEEVYDDLRALRTLGLVRVEGDDEVTQQFLITDKGQTAVQRMLDGGHIPRVLFEAIEKVKTKFNHLDLDELLSKVYNEYPEYAEQSLIRDRYLY